MGPFLCDGESCLFLGSTAACVVGKEDMYSLTVVQEDNETKEDHNITSRLPSKSPGIYCNGCRAPTSFRYEN